VGELIGVKLSCKTIATELRNKSFGYFVRLSNKLVLGWHLKAF